MTKKKIKNILDFTPLLILTIPAIILIWTIATTDIVFLWKHIVGLILLPINYLLFFWRHKVGILGLGLTLLLGLLSLLSYSPATTTTTLYKSMGDGNVPFFHGQIIFLLWIVVHLIVSGRHYVGIATKKYWNGLINNSDVSFD